MDFAQLDPSVALAFYFRDRTEFETFCKDCGDHLKIAGGTQSTATKPILGSFVRRTIIDDSTSKRHYSSLFGILENPPVLSYTGDDSGDEKSRAKTRDSWEIDSLGDGDASSSDDEFVIV
jgi:hypothetical protein